MARPEGPISVFAGALPRAEENGDGPFEQPPPKAEKRAATLDPVPVDNEIPIPPFENPPWHVEAHQNAK